MANIWLPARAREQLERVVHDGLRGRDVRRAQALLWLSEGVSVSEIARRTRLTRQAIYCLVTRYSGRHGCPVVERVRDAPRSGRPATKMSQVLEVLEPFLKQSPHAYGYRACCWTVPMLQAQVRRQTAWEPSDDLIRRALKRLRYRYKRPRYVLSRRGPTWRQVKGGSKWA
jgi:transposase